HGCRIEKPQRALEDGAHAVIGGEHIDGARLHQILETIRNRRFASADRPEEVENLLLFFQALGAVTEEPDDALDRLLQTVEILEGRIDLEHPVHEDASK